MFDELEKATNIVLKNNKKYLNDKEVDYVDDIKEMMQYLESKQLLFKILSVRLEEKVYGISRSGAPIIGIPFDIAIENIINGKRNVKSMYYIDDNLESRGLEGRLISYCQENNNEIQF